MDQGDIAEDASILDPPWPMTGDGTHPRIGHPSLYRNFPKQARSRETAAAVLSAACTLSREVGDVSIDAVAHTVGLSKAAVYRFFWNDHSLRTTLASQELELYLDDMTDALRQRTCARWQDVVLLHATIRWHAYRTRKGPAMVSERYRAESNESEIIAEYLLGEIALRFADDLIPHDVRHRIEIAIRLIDALIGREFQGSGVSVDSVMEECRTIVDRHLSRSSCEVAQSLVA